MQFETSNWAPIPRWHWVDVIWPAATLTFGVLFTFAWIGLLAWIALRSLM